MFVYERAVRFEDVDAARIVFFPRIFGYCHEAMEALFAGALKGGYAGLINDRHVGLPTVHVASDFKSPLRYGDVARIEIRVARIGTTSCNFTYRITRAKDAVLAVTIEQTCVVADLTGITKIAIPDDVRAVLEAHRDSA